MIIHGHSKGYVAMQRRTSSRLARRLLRREMRPRCETLNTRGAQGPPKASDARWLTHVDHALMPMGRSGADVVVTVDLARQSFDA